MKSVARAGAVCGLLMLAYAGPAGPALAEVEWPVASDGQTLFAGHCARCHGADAKGGDTGNGRGAAADLTRLARDNGGAFPRVSVLSQIDGYTRSQTAGQSGSHDMPEFGALLNGPSIPVDTADGVMTPTPWPLVALLTYLESVQK